MSNEINTLSAQSDEELWRLSCNGEREAFGAIVDRYKALVCSLVYSNCGALGASEDLAQETFITAWMRIKDLREPTKLRSWLCGIARNLAANNSRRELRRGGPPESLEAAAAHAVEGPGPDEQAVKSEEEELVWRALESLSADYREPLVLFYRQGQSVSEVARSLELTEENARQRLSRGRAMLRKELTSLVETTLTRTRPSPAFTAAVVAALPFAAIPSASAAAAASMAGKGLSATAKASASMARSAEEKECILRLGRRMVLFCFVMSVGLALVLGQAGKLYKPSPLLIIAGIGTWLTVLLGVIIWASARTNSQIQQIRERTGTDDGSFSAMMIRSGSRFPGPLHHESRFRLLGLPLISFSISSLEAGSVRRRSAVGWLAVGDVAISPVIALGGVAVAPMAVGGLTVGFLSLSLWGAALGIVAFGSLAIGWTAFGVASAGWKAAWGGGVAWAGDYAVGGWAMAAEANTPAAKQWFASQWYASGIAFFAGHAHWLIMAAVALSLTWLLRRARMIRRVV